MDNAQILLSRLEKVKSHGHNQWQARCPAHADKSPSLGVKALPDGRVLINCLAGCGGADVMEAVGLTLADLYPEAMPDFKPNWHMTNNKNESDHNKLLLKLYQGKRSRGEELTCEDMAAERAAFLAIKKGA